MNDFITVTTIINKGSKKELPRIATMNVRISHINGFYNGAIFMYSGNGFLKVQETREEIAQKIMANTEVTQ